MKTSSQFFISQISPEPISKLQRSGGMDRSYEQSLAPYPSLHIHSPKTILVISLQYCSTKILKNYMTKIVKYRKRFNHHCIIRFRYIHLDTLIFLFLRSLAEIQKCHSQIVLYSALSPSYNSNADFLGRRQPKLFHQLAKIKQINFTLQVMGSFHDVKTISARASALNT